MVKHRLLLVTANWNEKEDFTTDVAMNKKCCTKLSFHKPLTVFFV